MVFDFMGGDEIVIECVFLVLILVEVFGEFVW